MKCDILHHLYRWWRMSLLQQDSREHLTFMAPSFLNIGTGDDITIRDTAALIAELVGFAGETVYNPDQPDGTPRKLLSTARINALGWQPHFSLKEGLADAYRWYLDQA